MYKNPNDKDVITFKNWLINIYQTPFLDQNLTNALSIPNTLKYQKIQEIYYYLPFMLSNNIYQTYFFEKIKSGTK